MSPRLAELLRQRRLLQEHTDWLEQEIAREQGVSDAGDAIDHAPSGIALPPRPLPASSNTAETEAEEILRHFEPEVHSSSEDAKRGCLIAFGLLMLALSAGIAAAFFFYGDKADTPVSPAAKKASSLRW